MRQFFFPNKRKNHRRIHTDVAIRIYAVLNLGEGAARKREIMKPVRTLVSNRLAKSSVNINTHLKQSKINCP